jgi:hypothetical protein
MRWVVVGAVGLVVAFVAFLTGGLGLWCVSS